jgi:hypothetical protein
VVLVRQGHKVFPDKAALGLLVLKAAPGPLACKVQLVLLEHLQDKAALVQLVLLVLQVLLVKDLLVLLVRLDNRLLLTL